MNEPPQGYLGAGTILSGGPADELVDAGYALETADAPLLHHGLTLADLAHVVALHESKLMPADAAGALLDALVRLWEVPPEDFPYDAVYGDAYNSRERYLERELGNVAGWLHTGRTRREAGRIAFRLAVRRQLSELQQAVVAFSRALVERGHEHTHTAWNDTTYLQPAQPSTFGHYLAGFATEAVRHLGRLEAARVWADRSPAGAGGVGGTRLSLDRDRLADLLGFATVAAHTRDAMWSTDGLVDAVVAAAQTATTVDRLAEDLEILASPQFDVVRLDASVCRASVLLPQKRNPYALAVIRGGASTLIGRATGSLTTQRTPSARTDNWLHTYGETAGSLELARRLTALGARVVTTLEIRSDRLAGDAGAHFSCATDLAEELVAQAGVDYRTAYHLVGTRVAAAQQRGQTAFNADDIEALATAAEARGAAVARVDLDRAADPVAAISSRTAAGGASPPRVAEHLHALGAELDDWTDHAASALQRDDHAAAELVARARAVAATRDASP